MPRRRPIGEEGFGVDVSVSTNISIGTDVAPKAVAAVEKIRDALYFSGIFGIMEFRVHG
jgi:hypothetical protein